jgi:Tol biopolymer transport system component
MIGKTVSHYRILEKLGGGGMGVVYKGQDLLLERPVALKVLAPELLKDPTALSAFVREAKAASALNHPNILTVHDLVEAEGTHLIVMELVEGRTLRACLGKKGLEFKELSRIAIQVGEALAAAHQAGIVHRDLKPENIMVRADGHVKVVDFGLAKLLGAREQTQMAAATQDVTVTAPGALPAPADMGAQRSHIAGTLPYMSPEQVTGKAVDHRTDIFSFGVVLYEMATGQQPFQSRTTVELVEAILGKEPPPVTELSRVVPERLQEIIAKAIEKDPADRYQGMEDLVVDLRRLKRVTDSGRAVAVAPVYDRRPGAAARRAALQKPWLLVLAGAALLALALIGLGLYRLVWRKPAPVPFQAMKLTMLTASGKVQHAVISPDGKYLAYVVADAGMQSLWVRQLATSSDVQIIPPSDTPYTGLTFSLDGNYIYYVRQESKQGGTYGTLYEMPVLGGASRKLIANVDSRVASSPDGKQLAFVREYPDQHETALIVVNADGTAERKLATRKSPAKFETGGPAWSPDAKVVAVGAEDPRPASGKEAWYGVVVLNAQDGKDKTFSAKEWGRVSEVAWLPDGSGVLALVYGERSQIWHLAYPSGQTRRITNDTNNYNGLSVTADGKALVTVSSKRSSTRLWAIPKDEWSHPRDISPGTSEEDGLYGFSWMPDGRILYTSMPSGRWSLWVVNRDGSNPKEFPVGVPEGSVGLGVSACPDGRYVVFGSRGIVRVDSEGGNLKRITTDRDLFPRCSPDGQWVVYLSTRGTLWKIPIEGGTPVQLRDKMTLWFAISRDGKWIACTEREDPNQPVKLIVLPMQGGPPSKTFDAPPGLDFRAFDWTPDGRSINFSAIQRGQRGAYNVWTQPLTGGPPRQLTSLETGRILSVAWSPDGKDLLLVRITEASDAVLISNFIGSGK